MRFWIKFYNLAQDLFKKIRCWRLMKAEKRVILAKYLLERGMFSRLVDIPAIALGV